VVKPITKNIKDFTKIAMGNGNGNGNRPRANSMSPIKKNTQNAQRDDPYQTQQKKSMDNTRKISIGGSSPVQTEELKYLEGGSISYGTTNIRKGSATLQAIKKDNMNNPIRKGSVGKYDAFLPNNTTKSPYPLPAMYFVWI